MKPNQYKMVGAWLLAGLLVGCGGDDDDDSTSPDRTPDAFTFDAMSGQEPATLTTSSQITISGIDNDTDVSIEGGEYAIGGDGFTTGSGLVSDGDTIQVRTTSSAVFGEAVEVSLTIGDTSVEFRVTTRDIDTTPDAFSFDDVSGVAPESLVTSDSVTISGFDQTLTINVSDGASYAINGGDFTSDSGQIASGDSLVIQTLTSDEFSAETQISIEVGATTETFIITTVGEFALTRVEAADSELLGDAVVSTDPTGFVNNIVSVGSGIRMDAPIAAESITIGYLADSDGSISVIVDGEMFSSFIFDATSEDDSTGKIVAINKAIPFDADIDIIMSEGDSSLAIDYVEFNPEKIPSISTIAQVDSHTDGITVTPEGNILLGGSYPILQFTPEGELSELPATTLDSGNPLGMDFDSEGNLYSANYSMNAVEIYAADGTNSEFTSGGLNGPNSLIVDQNDELAVASCGLTSLGTSIVRLGSDGSEREVIEVDTSNGTCIAGITIDDLNNLYVSNWSYGRIFSIDPDNNVELVGEVTGANINHITYSNGYIYAPAPIQSLLHRFTLDGEMETYGTTKAIMMDGDIRTADYARTNSITTANDGETLYFSDEINNVTYLRKMEFVENVPQSPPVPDDIDGETSVTFNVQVPDDTPEDATIFITGDFELPGPWSGGATMNPDYQLTRNSDGSYRIELTLPTYTSIQFKFTLGSWLHEEVQADGSRRLNRAFISQSSELEADLVIERWLAIP